MPFPFTSHISELTNIGEALVQRGHELSILLPRTLPEPDIQKIKKMKGINIITWRNIAKDGYEYMADQGGNFDDQMDVVLTTKTIDEFRDVHNMASTMGWVQMCTNPLRDEQLLSTLAGKQFDLAILDAFQMSRCLAILLYKLDIPFVSVITIYEPWLLRNPALPSFVPFILSDPMTTAMSFWGRLHNTWTELEWTVSPRCPMINDKWVREYVPEKPHITINDILRKSLLWFTDTDNVLDYPRPYMPNEVMIGGLTTKPTKPLPDDIDMFMSEAKDGVIIVSFGSSEANLPEYVRSKLKDALSETGLHIVWRYPHSIPDNMPKRFKLLTWMPQNDILAHPNVKLFITHCGANGQFEGLYNGVPMLGIPMFGDQPYNARRLKHHNYGDYVHILEFTTDELYGKIMKIISDQSYKENIMRASKIFKDRPMTPRERAVYWIEHVMKYGGDHLHSYALDMPWYQYIMLDIFLFIMTLAILCVLMVAFVCNYIHKQIFHTSHTLQDKKRN